MAKQYGLIVSNKAKPLHPMGAVKPSIFGDDSDSDSGHAKPTGLKTALKRQDRLLQEKAVEEDPTVFQYDELYDDMDAKRKESKLSRKDLDKKPKYINKLLESAERRKRENERRIERQVQKEREAEGEQFKDKESFVTSAYRAKLEEMKKMDEQEQREDYLEAIGDVTKQGNLDGFYRHLYDQKVLSQDGTVIKEEPPEKADENQSKGSPEVTEENSGKSKEKWVARKRKYRKRDESSDSEPEAPHVEAEKNLQHLPSNIDADSDFSIDSSDSEEEGEAKKKKVSQDEVKTLAEATKVPVTEAKLEEDEAKDVIIKEEAKSEESDVNKVSEDSEKEHKPKIDIWKKRTIGEVFDEALRRYFERKSLREAGTYVRPSL